MYNFSPSLFSFFIYSIYSLFFIPLSLFLLIIFNSIFLYFFPAFSIFSPLPSFYSFILLIQPSIFFFFFVSSFPHLFPSFSPSIFPFPLISLYFLSHFPNLPFTYLPLLPSPLIFLPSLLFYPFPSLQFPSLSHSIHPPVITLLPHFLSLPTPLTPSPGRE